MAPTIRALLEPVGGGTLLPSLWPLLVIWLPRRWRLPLLGSLVLLVPVWRSWGMHQHGFGGLNTGAPITCSTTCSAALRWPSCSAGMAARKWLRGLAANPVLGLLLALGLIAPVSSFEFLIDHGVTNKLKILAAAY